MYSIIGPQNVMSDYIAIGLYDYINNKTMTSCNVCNLDKKNTETQGMSNHAMACCGNDMIFI